jgi:ABC-type phosphate/phosphonate transport system substrate-binding protein
MKKGKMCLLFVLALFLCLPAVSNAEQFKITVMQDQAGAAQKFKPVADYLATKGIQVSFVSAKDYSAAAYMFSVGEVDAMFSGSGIAGSFIIKELAVPLVRPVDLDGHSTYWAAVIGPKGSPKFNGSAEYFKGKKVIFTSLASAGEFYFRSLPGASQAQATLLKAASHGDALDALNKGQADFAIVKNRVWDDTRAKYPNLTMVGEDRGENPDNTLIVTRRIPQTLAAKISTALLAVKDDTSPEALAVKKSMQIKGFVKTTDKDFDHTLALLSRAGATKSFNFMY